MDFTITPHYKGRKEEHIDFVWILTLMRCVLLNIWDWELHLNCQDCAQSECVKVYNKKGTQEMKFSMIIFSNNKRFMNLLDIGYSGNYYKCEHFKLNGVFQITDFRTYLNCHFIRWSQTELVTCFLLPKAH